MTNPHFTDSNHLYLSDRETEAGVDCLRLTVSQSVCPGDHVGPLVSPGVSSVLPGIVFSWLTVVGRVVPAVQPVQSLQWRHASLLLSANIIMCWLFSYQVSHKTLSAPMTTDMAHYVVSLFYRTKLHRMSVETVWGSRSLLSCLISTDEQLQSPTQRGPDMVSRVSYLSWSYQTCV